MESPDHIILHGSDAEVEALISQSPKLGNQTRIVLLSSRFLAKTTMSKFFADTMEATQTALSLGIRTPKIIRTIQRPDLSIFVMERIDGQTLDEAWIGLGWWASLRLALQLRRFISSLRSITSDRAGGLVTGSCESFWLEDRFRLPARATVQCVLDFLAFWAGFQGFIHESKKSDHEVAVLNFYPELQTKNFVLTHHDLAPRNIMVDASGDAWLIDWELAGFYPVYFEYAAMYNFIPRQTWGLRWRVFTWLAAGGYEKQRQHLVSIRSKFLLKSKGRARNIKAKVTQTRSDNVV